MTSLSRLVPYALTVVGLGAGASALQLHLWNSGRPAAGLFPFLAASLLVLSSLACNLEKATEAEPVDHPRLAGYSAALVGFCILLYLVGFAISAFAFLSCVFVIIERLDWKRSVLFAAAFSLTTWGLFEWVLSVPLPHGEWRF